MAFGDEILALIREIQEAELEELKDCPLCGWPLDKKDDGTLYCRRFDGFNTGGLSTDRSIR